MTLKTSLAVIALSLLPAAAFAGGGCRGEKHDQTAMSCVEGHVWDAAKGTCVPQPSS